MKPTTYIDWDNLVNIPFLFCQAVEDEKEQDFDIYYMGKLVLHDYNHCGHYLYTATVLFGRIKNILFCQAVEDEKEQDFDIYYMGKLVLHDYNHCGHYLYTATVLFGRIKNRAANWVNLRNLWILRNCIRENYNHGIGVDDLIYGENFDGEHLDTLTPLTKKRFELIIKRIQELDPYATI